jgi:hypothetical protein
MAIVFNNQNHGVMIAQKPGGQISQNVKPDGSSNIQSAPGANRCAFDACKALAEKYHPEAVKIFSPENPDQANLDEAVRLINDNENKYSEEFIIEINSINNSKPQILSNNFNNMTTNFVSQNNDVDRDTDNNSQNFDTRSSSGSIESDEVEFICDREKNLSWHERIATFFAVIKNRKSIIENNKESIKHRIIHILEINDSYRMSASKKMINKSIVESAQLQTELGDDPNNNLIKKQININKSLHKHLINRYKTVCECNIFLNNLINSINNNSNIDLLDSCFKLEKHMEKLNRPCSFPPEVQKVLSNPFVRFLSLF